MFYFKSVAWKQLTGVLWSLTLLLPLVYGCSADEEDSTDKEGGEVETPGTQEEEEGAGELSVDGTGEITLRSSKTTNYKANNNTSDDVDIEVKFDVDGNNGAKTPQLVATYKLRSVEGGAVLVPQGSKKLKDALKADDTQTGGGNNSLLAFHVKGQSKPVATLQGAILEGLAKDMMGGFSGDKPLDFSGNGDNSDVADADKIVAKFADLLALAKQPS